MVNTPIEKPFASKNPNKIHGYDSDRTTSSAPTVTAPFAFSMPSDDADRCPAFRHIPLTMSNNRCTRQRTETLDVDVVSVTVCSQTIERRPPASKQALPN